MFQCRIIVSGPLSTQYNAITVIAMIMANDKILLFIMIVVDVRRVCFREQR